MRKTAVFLASGFVSAPLQGADGHALSPNPRQKPKILAAHRYIFSVNALIAGVQTPYLMSWETGGIRFVVEHLVERGPVQIPTPDENSGDPGCVADFFKRVSIKENKVSGFLPISTVPSFCSQPK